MNNLPRVKCNLYHPYSRWCRKACRCLREILTYRDQRSRCVINNIGQTYNIDDGIKMVARNIIEADKAYHKDNDAKFMGQIRTHMIVLR